MGFKFIVHSLLILFIAITCVRNGSAQSESESVDWDLVPEILNSINEPTIPQRDYVITRFHADTANALPAITEAIKHASESGGGRIIIPAGIWMSKGPIHLKSNINLHLEDGAVLRFSEEPKDYLPQVLTRWEGTEAYNFSPLIYAYQAHNVAITGKGIIDGNSKNGFGKWRDLQDEAQNRLREMGSNGTPVYKRVFGLKDFLRPSMIQFYGCTRILLQDITILDSPMWVNHFIYSSQIVVRGIKIKSYRLNNDGIDIDSSTLVLIEDNAISTGDDSIVIKSGRDQDGWRVGKPSENIIIRNNYMDGHNALAVGSEMSGGVSNIFMENNKLGKVLSAIYFKSNLDRGGYIKDVRVRYTEVQEADVLIRFSTDYHSHRGGQHPSLYKDFVIENISAEKVRLAIEATGVEELPIQDVLIKNLEIKRAEIDHQVKHVKNFRYENVFINGKILRN